MHICLPDTREVKPLHGSAFLLYNVHIDGLYHCSLRFKQLLHLHQALSKKFTSPFHQLPPFPPKKLLPLSAAQVEERRTQLEKYLQNISQDKAICNSSIFNLFLLEAQRESTRIREDQVHLDVELVNGQKIRLQIVTHDSADAVLTAVCRALGLDDRYHAYFCLCLCGYDVARDKLIIKRRLSFFESPYVTLQMAIQQQDKLQNVLSSSNGSGNGNNCRCQSCSAQQQSSNSTTGVPLVGSSSGSYVNNYLQGHYNQSSYNHNHHHHQQQHHHQYHQGNHHHHNQACYYQNRRVQNASSGQTATIVTHRILLRKSYWDPIYDTYILNDQQALNLLFIQTVYDIKHSLMFVNRETYHQLESLLASDSKMEYILLARTLKYYNYVHFEPCLSDYPRPRTKVMISIGSKELNMRVLKSLKSITSSSASSSASSSLLAQNQAHSNSNSNNNNNNTNSINLTNNSNTPPAPNNNSSTHQMNMPSDQVLYCTSSSVPSGYHHLITKDELIEEEYNFKVPLIRCWRLTSLETLNSNSTGSPMTGTGSRAAGNGKRKSLSLFNSVVGVGSGGNNNNNNNGANQENRQAESSRGNVISSGTGGSSLMAALTGAAHHGNNGSFSRRSSISSNNNNNNNDNHFCQHENQPGACCCCGSGESTDHTQFSQYELSFEYLISKDTLKWITICSDQAIFISISLQGVVDELVSKRDGQPSATSRLYKGGGGVVVDSPPTGQILPTRNNQESFTYMYRDGAQKTMNTSNQQLIDKFGTTLGYSPTNSYALALAHQRQQQARASAMFASFTSRFSSSAITAPETSGAGGHHATAFEISNFKKAPSPIINDAFEGVTNDDDL